MIDLKEKYSSIEECYNVPATYSKGGEIYYTNYFALHLNKHFTTVRSSTDNSLQQDHGIVGDEPRDLIQYHRACHSTTIRTN